MDNKQFILKELKTMKKGCKKECISEFEWVEKYADEFRKKHEKKIDNQYNLK